MKTTMSAHVEDYLARLAKLSPRTTVKHNRTALTRFARWRDGQRKSPRTLQGPEVEDYFVDMAGEVAAGTWNAYRGITVKFLRWGAQRGYWPPGAVVDLPARQAEPKPKVYLNDEQMDALLDKAPDVFTRFALAALRWTLCREQELLGVRISDLDRGRNRIRIVRTKGRRANPQDKVDFIPVVAELVEELDAWLAEYERLCGPLQPHWRLIPSRLPNPAGRSGPTGAWTYYPDRKRKVLGDMVKANVARLRSDLSAEELRGVGSHTMRRSGGLEMREALRDAGESEADYQVMAMFGHKDIRTTYGYFGEDKDRARRDVALAGRRLRPKKAEVVTLRVVESDAG
jgi:integrase